MISEDEHKKVSVESVKDDDEILADGVRLTKAFMKIAERTDRLKVLHLAEQLSSKG